MTKHTTQERTRMTKLQNKAFGLINTLQRQHKIDGEQATDFTYRVGYGALNERDVKDVIAKLEVISRQPAPWQRDPNQITTEHVQFWSRGVMVTCTMTKAAAQESVKAGRSFIISSQAIGALAHWWKAEWRANMEEVRITVSEFMKKVAQKNFKPSTLNDRVGQCNTCGANREVTYWREDEVLKKFIIVSCNH